MQAVPHSEVLGCGGKMPDPCFEPFISDGLVPLTANPSDLKPIHILRETGGSQTVIFSGVLPFLSAESTCGFNSVLLPVHRVYVKSELATGFFPLSVCTALPVDGVAMLMGNDIAGGFLLPNPEVLDNHLNQTIPDSSVNSGLYPACMVTCA